ncbi:hypothetical protein HK101_006609 [Irineochytrium annulatum]|nr:hypothetical protein HK101_006609 [Irineochytrium annulatum]
MDAMEMMDVLLDCLSGAATNTAVTSLFEVWVAERQLCEVCDFEAYQSDDRQGARQTALYLPEPTHDTTLKEAVNLKFVQQPIQRDNPPVCESCMAMDRVVLLKEQNVLTKLSEVVAA